MSPLSISGAGVAGILFLVVCLVWALYSLIAIYHWSRYSHAALIAIPAIAVYLVVSAIFIVFAFTGLAAA